MKKKVLSLVLTAAMMTTMLAGCGSSDNGSTAASTGEAPAAATTEAAAASTEAAPAEEVTLKWAIWDQETTQYWGDIKDAYEAPLREAPPMPPKKVRGTLMTKAQGQDTTKNIKAQKPYGVFHSNL